MCAVPSNGDTFPYPVTWLCPKATTVLPAKRRNKVGLFLMDQLDFPPQPRSGLGCLTDAVRSKTQQQALGSGRLCSAVLAPQEGWPGLGQPWLQETPQGCRQPTERSRGRTLPKCFISHQPCQTIPAHPQEFLCKTSFWLPRNQGKQRPSKHLTN